MSQSILIDSSWSPLRVTFVLFLFTCLQSPLHGGKVFATPHSFHSEYCGFNTWPSGSNQVTCTFATPQSGIIRHQLSLAELNKPGNADISFQVVSCLLSPTPSASATFQVRNWESATVKLGFFLILIKDQLSTKYIDFVQMYVPRTTTNVSDSSNTIRYYAVDTDINTSPILTGFNLNNLKIVPFITSYSLQLSSSIINSAGSEYDFMFVFTYQILSANMLRMRVTIQPTISMQEFKGSMLLVNIQQIQNEKAAFLSNPTLSATDSKSQKYVIGDTTAGKLGSADFQILFADFGTSFNTKCFLGFEKISYTKLTQFSYQLGKNTLNNYHKYSQTAATLTGLIPEISTVFFCYGLAKECSDLSTYYDRTDQNCYTPSTCPLPVPGGPGDWPHTNICPWCQELICTSCSPTNRSQCSACQPGTNSFLNTVTKQCECDVGYHFAYRLLSPVTWNSAMKSGYNCIVNCTHRYPGCDLNQCNSAQCFQCLFDHMFVYPSSGPRFCQKCSTIQSNCITCTVLYLCDTCQDGYYKFQTRSLTYPSQVLSRSCQPCIPQCKVCPDNLVCTTCYSGYELINSNSQCVCKPSLAGLLNCNACTVNTTCTSCDSGFYLSSSTGLCEPCSNIHPECKNCSDQNTCSSCSFGYGTDPAAVTGKVVCSLCNKLVNYCDDCIQISHCLHCVAPYGVAAPLQCMYCELLKFPGCIECTISSAPCTKCNSTSFLLNGTCFFCHIYYDLCTSCQANDALQTLECLSCQPGYYVGLNLTSNRNQCLPCSKAMNKCLECTNSTFCTKCKFPNMLGTTNQCTQCEFPYVNYNNGTCVKYAGCANILETSPGVMICLACNDSLHFVFQPSSKNCLCGHGYYETISPQPTQKCQNICGDGILIMPEEQCDDKNLIDYDGCSKNCKEETYFDCDTLSPSKCILIRDFTKFEFVYAERIAAENKGILYFSIEPKEIGLTYMNWSKLITINFVSNSVKVSSLTFSYSFDTGMVKVQFPYTQTVENSMISYQIKLDPSMIKSTQSVFKDVCQVKGANFPLIVENSLILEHSQYIELIALVLSVLAMVQFYLGSYLGKMIGLETIQIFQFVCFSRFLVFTKNTTLLTAFHDLKYSSTGFSNPQVLYGPQSVSSNQLISTQFNKIDIQKYYLLNINFWLIPIALVVLAYLVVSIRKWFEWRILMEGNEPSAKYKYVLTRRSVQYIYEQCIFPQVMMIGMLVYFNNLLCFLVDDVVDENKITALEIHSNVFQTLSQYAISAVFAYEVMASLKEFIRPQSQEKHALSLHQKYQLDDNSPHKPNYHPLYIFLYSMYYFLLYMIMSLDVEIDSFTLSLEITIIMTLGYFVCICYWPPYFKIVNIHNTFLKINHSIAVAVLVIYEVFNRAWTNSVSPMAYVILAYVILGFLSIVLIGGFVRIYFEHIYRKKLSYKLKQTRTKLTLVEEDQIVKRMTKKEKTDQMLINNRFTIKNQLSELKKSYFVNLGTSAPSQKLTKDQETFFMNKIKQEFQQKNHIYRDFWGIKSLKEPLVQEQITKPSELKNLPKDQPQSKAPSTTESNPNGEKYIPTKTKSKHSALEKEALQKLKRKLRSELIQIGEQNQ